MQEVRARNAVSENSMFGPETVGASELASGICGICVNDVKVFLNELEG